MLRGYLFVFLVQLRWFSLGLADATPTVTIPFVADAPDYFKGYGGKIVGATNDMTTYAINCLPDSESCHAFTPDLTVVYGPSTYGLTAQGMRFDLTSDCTLIGSPTPTQATCIKTTHAHAPDLVRIATVAVPDAKESTLGIYPAPLPVTDTGSFAGPVSVASTDATPTAQVADSDTSTTADGNSATTDPPASIYSVESGGYTVAGTLVPASSALTRHHNGTGNATGIAANGTVTVTRTVTALPSDVRCQCECDSKSTISQSPPQSACTSATKNYATKWGPPVALIWKAMPIAVFLARL
ncbi:hypothetical protein MYU51_009145 [Penicillium brevicompactum]